MNNIKNLFNSECGSDIFILGNGPSVLLENLNFLKDKIVIGMNASTILEQKFNFCTKYYVCSDVRFLTHPDKAKFALEQLYPSTIRVFRKELEFYDTYTRKDKTFYVRALQRDGFSPDLKVGFYYGCTTTMLAIQLAYYLGAKNIYLLGVDLSYCSKQPRFYSEKSFQIDDSYTSVQIFNIKNSHLFLKYKGVNLINCSEKSFLRPYIGFEKFIDVI